MKKRGWRHGQLFEAMFENGPDGMLILDTRTQKFVAANQRISRMLGRPPKELMAMSIADIHPKESLPDVMRSFDLLREGKIQVARDVPVQRLGGSVFYADIAAYPIAFEGKPFLVGVFRDVAERRKIKNALEESERRVRAVFDQTFQFIGLMTPDGVLIEANRSALDFAGIKASAVLDKPFWETPWWTHSPKLQQELRDAVKRVAAGEFVRFEATHRDKEGQLHHIDFSLKPVKDEAGSVIYMIPEGRDITVLKEAQEELSRARADLVVAAQMAALGRLGAGIAHQLNSPLAGAMLLVDSLNDRRSDDSNVARTVDKLRSSLENMRNIVEGMLILAGVHGPRRPKRVRVDVNATLRQLVQMSGVEFSRHAIAVAADLDPSVRKLEAHAGELEQVFINIINNAIDAMQAGGTLTIRSKAIPNGVEVRIRDTGPGIPPENLAKIFEPFFTTRRERHGVGLGLSIVRQIIENYGGRISVESEVGRGTEFLIFLPLHGVGVSGG